LDKVTRFFLIGLLGAIAFGQSHQDPKPDFRPSRELHISPSTIPQESQSVTSRPDYWVARGFSLKEIVAHLHNVEESRVILSPPLDTKNNPKERFDFALVLPQTEEDADRDAIIESAIQKYFAVTVAREKRATEVYVMTAPNGPSPSLRALPSASSSSISSGVTITTTSMAVENATMQDISQMLEQHLQRILVDETHLEGRYEFGLQGIPRGDDAFLNTLRANLGLDLRRAYRDVDMVVVGIANHSR